MGSIVFFCQFQFGWVEVGDSQVFGVEQVDDLCYDQFVNVLFGDEDISVGLNVGQFCSVQNIREYFQRIDFFVWEIIGYDFYVERCINDVFCESVLNIVVGNLLFNF